MVHKRGTFPNYLQKKHDEDIKMRDKEHEPHASAFSAGKLHNTEPSVPFLQQQKDDSKRPQLHHTEENNRFRRQSTPLSRQTFSFYKSRRPFKPTDYPSVWDTLREEEKQAQAINYGRIKEQLSVSAEDLILIERSKKQQLLNKKWRISSS